MHGIDLSSDCQLVFCYNFVWLQVRLSELDLKRLDEHNNYWCVCRSPGKLEHFYGSLDFPINAVRPRRIWGAHPEPTPEWVRLPYSPLFL